MNPLPFAYYSSVELEYFPSLRECEAEPVDWQRIIREIRHDATLLKPWLHEFETGKTNKATFIKQGQDYFDSIGYDPQQDKVLRNGIHDRASELRLKLMLHLIVNGNRNKKRKQAGCKDFLYDYPGWALVSHFSSWNERRDWGLRWRDAGESLNWAGASKSRMVALKESPIWKALGNGVGGYSDATHRDYPPFAIGSDMEWEDVARDICEELGLLATAFHAACPACGGMISIDSSMSGDIKCPYCGSVLTIGD